MNCSEVHNKLMSYLEDDLSDREMSWVREHLQTCKECNALYSKVKESWLGVKSDKIPYQPFYYTRLKQRMENRKVKPVDLTKISKLILQPAMYFVILGLGIFIGIQLGQSVENPNQQKAQTLEQDYFDAYTQDQYTQTFQIDSIEQTLLSLENIEDNE